MDLSNPSSLSGFFWCDFIKYKYAVERRREAVLLHPTTALLEMPWYIKIDAAGFAVLHCESTTTAKAESLLLAVALRDTLRMRAVETSVAHAQPKKTAEKKDRSAWGNYLLLSYNVHHTTCLGPKKLIIYTKAHIHVQAHTICKGSASVEHNK